MTAHNIAMKRDDAPGCTGGCACREEKTVCPRPGFWIARQGCIRAIVELTLAAGVYLVRPWGASEYDEHQSLTSDGDDGCGWTLIDWIDVDGRTGAFSAVIAERDAIAGERDAARAERDRLRARLDEVQRQGEATTEKAIEAGQEGIRYWKEVATAARDAWWSNLEENAPPDPADDGIPF